MRTILIFIILLGTILQARTYLYGPDGPNYYAVAKSLSFDRDLVFNNELKPDWNYAITITPTYHILEQHQIGASLVWMLIIGLFKNIGLVNEHNLGVVINLTEYLLGILALILIFRICIKFFDPKTSFLSILAVLFGTNLFAYITLLSGSSHVSSIFFISCFLLFYFNTGDKRSNIDWLILGGLAGLMLMARGDASLYLIFPAFDLFRYIKNKDFKKAIFCSFVFILGLLFIFSPQIVFWKIIFGKIFRPYGEPDFFTGNKFLEVLFSCSRGFFSFSPLLAICFLIGIFFLYKKDKMLVILTTLIFLILDYVIGRAKYGWWQGWSFGGRYFLIFMPLFILAVAACFKRLSFKSQIIITVISSLWSFLLFILFIRYRIWSTYKFIITGLNSTFFYETLQCMYNFFNKNLILKFFFLKSVFFISNFLFISLLWKLSKSIRISKPLLKRISIYLVSGIIIYINLIFIECYFNDQKVIAKLKKDGFYKDAVFGDFDKGDIAAAYLEFAEWEIRDGRISSAINAIRSAMRVYPPYQEGCFEYLYDIYTAYPKDFKVELLSKPDAFDYLELSLTFYEKEDFKNAKYYFQEALRLKSDIIEVVKDKKDPYLSSRLDKAFDFFSKIREEI